MSLLDDVWATLPTYVRDADEAGGYPLRTWLSALCDQAQPVIDLLDPDTISDPAVTPTNLLSWLAALGGIDISGVPADQVRTFLVTAQISDYYVDTYTEDYTLGAGVRVARARGSVEEIVTRVGLTLTGTKHVDVTCPYLGDPHSIRVSTWTTETPDPTETAAAAYREVPAWLDLTVAQLIGIEYVDLAARFPIYADLTYTGSTYSTLAALT